MNNKEWLLNAAAIKAARMCIKSVQNELGVRLTLSHPDFFNLMTEYTELTDCLELKRNFEILQQYVDDSGAEPTETVVVPFSTKVAAQDIGVTNIRQQTALAVEKIVFHGREYNRWKEGREFKGLYRGQPRYA